MGSAEGEGDVCMEVKLLNHTPLWVAERAGRTCTATVEKCEQNSPLPFLQRITEQGHESVIEHRVYTFEVRDISRALLQELARHRHLSLSVESTRWALKRILDAATPHDLGDLIRIPAELTGDPEAMGHILDLIYFVHQWSGPNDLKKYMLPECWKTNLVMTLNLRELRHIYKLRTSKRALREFRELVEALSGALPFEHRTLLMIGMEGRGNAEAVI